MEHRQCPSCIEHRQCPSCIEHRQCPSCGKHWYSSEGQAIWECECGAEIKKETEVEMIKTEGVET